MRCRITISTVFFLIQLYDTVLQMILTFANKYVTYNDLILMAMKSIQYNLC